jgi:hypothetical protein
MTYTRLTCGTPEFATAIAKIGLENLNRGDYAPLTSLEVEIVIEFLRGRPGGKCTLPNIFGLFWSEIKNRKRFGIRFSTAVKAGQIPYLSVLESTGPGTKKYEYRPAAEAANAAPMMRAA